jgi:hypothetical protein
MLKYICEVAPQAHNNSPSLERRIGEAIVDCGFALAHGIGQDDAGLPIEEAEEEIERCQDALTRLKEAWNTAAISFEATAYQHGVAVLRERLGPKFPYEVLDILVKWVLEWYEEASKTAAECARPA